MIPETEDNVFGVVSYFEPAVRTKGDDWLTKAHLIDPSAPDAGSSLKLLLFHEETMAPPIHAVGDIMRCHRLKMNKFETIHQGIGNKRTSSCVVFDGQVDAPVTVRTARADKRSHSLSTGDCDIIQSLRNWYADRVASTTAAPTPTHASGYGRTFEGGNHVSLAPSAQTMALGGSFTGSQEIKDISSLGYNTGYFCLTAQIVSISHNEKFVTLKVTDYTDNDHVV